MINQKPNVSKPGGGGATPPPTGVGTVVSAPQGDTGEKYRYPLSTGGPYKRQFITGDNNVPIRTPQNAEQVTRWEQRYGSYNPKGFDLPKVRVPGVDVNRADYLYGGQGQDYWNAQAAQAQGRQAFQGDFRNADAMRAQQMGQLGQAQQTRQMYLDAAMGNAPSLAQAQLQQGVDRGIAGQLAVANSARGSAAQRAGAMRGAQLQGQEMMAGLGAQSGALRAQEIASARQGLLGADAALAQNMSGIRGQDVGQAGMNLQANMANRAQNDAYAQALQGYGMGAAGAEMAGRQGYAGAQNTFDFNTQIANANIEQGIAAREMDLGKSAMGGGGAAAGGLLGLLAFSDKRAKTKIAVGDKDVDAFLKTLKPYSYEYKDKAHGEGRKTSVMAQDLEKTSLGDTLVSRHKSGLRQVDYAKALPVMLASVGRLAERLEKAEARK